ncbi:hypothetical protein PWT90_06815 [Aphanocladium album]|nr:hypothetical protein PWT90_06815 [Aphanocladium album]
MKFPLAAAAAATLASVASGSAVASRQAACPASFAPGEHWCDSPGGAGDIYVCNNELKAVAVDHCPGRCIQDGHATVCQYRGWDDKCDNPGGEYNVWCEKDGGPSGIRTCNKDGRQPVTYLCDGICMSNGGHAMCLPEGARDKCPEGVQKGQSRCDVPWGAGKIRTCTDWGTFEVTDKCKDVCDPFYNHAKCIDKLH